jgi:trehalose 6-phosphate synthase
MKASVGSMADTGWTSAMEAPVVVASNRGPISYSRDDHGKLVPSKGSGGLVTAMAGVFFHDDATWVAAAMSDEDVEIARTGRAVGAGPSQRVRFVHIPPDRFDLYYNEFSNRVLWFAHHYLWDVPRTPVFGDDTRMAWDAYGEGNAAFAKELAKEARRDPVFLVQDYHLTLVPRMLRELAPEARIVHYSHTPFAGPEYLRILPTRMREGLMRGMAGADLIGFQSRAWAENFLLSARSVRDLHVDLRRGRIESEGHEAQVRVFPVAVNPHALRDASATARAETALAEAEEVAGDRKLMLRVDRLEPSKNILRGFLAYELLLKQHKEWRGKVTFLTLLSPTRDKLTEYQTYGDDCLTAADRITDQYGKGDWQPIVTRIQEDFLYAVGAYGAYDVLVVNPVYDGMNLVAMEGPLMNRRQGALVLSRNAGAAERIGRYALLTNPFDTEETAEAMLAALEMPQDERQRRARGINRTVLAHTPEGWLWNQLEGVDEVARRRDRPTSQRTKEPGEPVGPFDDQVGGAH